MSVSPISQLKHLPGLDMSTIYLPVLIFCSGGSDDDTVDGVSNMPILELSILIVAILEKAQKENPCIYFRWFLSSSARFMSCVLSLIVRLSSEF